MEAALLRWLHALQQVQQGSPVLQAMSEEDLICLCEADGLVSSLLDGWLRHLAALPDDTYAPLAAHLSDAQMAEAYPLHLQEYSVLVGEEPRWRLPLWEAMAQVSWPRELLGALLQAVQEGDRAAAQEAVDELQQRLDVIASEALEIVAQIEQLRALKAEYQLSAVQGEACLVARVLERPLEGAEVIDLGCAEGSVVGYFRAQGAHVSGLEIDEDWRRTEEAVAEAQDSIASRNFLAMPRDQVFDLVTATGFFESGAFVWPETGDTDSLRFQVHCDQLLQQVSSHLSPGGCLVIRNFTEPISFREVALAPAGLQFLHVLAPTAAARFTGRSVCFRKVA